MNRLEVDVAIIGGGTAGLGAYRTAKSHTDKVLLIEGGEFGTTCARVGCMPSKLLIAAAESVHQIQKAPLFGVHLQGKARINGQAVMSRVKAERDRFVGFVLEGVNDISATDKVVGFARFLDDNRLLIDQSEQGLAPLEVVAKRIVIATGSRPSCPEDWHSLGDKLIVNDDVFAWSDLPRSVVVMGPGVIGLELGQALQRLGVEVNVFGLSGQVAALTDPAVSEYALKTFAEEFYLDASAQIQSIKRVSASGGARSDSTDDHQAQDLVEVTFINQSGELEIVHAEYLLATTGRRANVDGLDLQNTSLRLDEKGIPHTDNETMQTSCPHIFMAGDANNLLPLLHEAADQGRIAGENAGTFPIVHKGLRRSSLSVVFSDPQIAMVGKSHRQLTQELGACGCFEIGTVSFEDQGRSRVMLKNKGVLNLYGEQGTGRFLGAEMIGPCAEHLAHLLAWAHQQQMTVSEMLEMPFYHPVIEEGVRTALRDLNAKLHLGPEMISHCLDCGPGC